MLQMLEDCRAGKIDYILAKSIARFARNVVDCLSIIEELKNMNPPVGVYFEADNLYTLDSTGALVLTIMATLAEEESRNKSVIMNWSIDRRFSRGIFLTPELLGYDRDENGELVVNPQEAETVKVIYDLYINGWTPKEIADLLTEYGRKTKLGNEVWNPGTIRGVIGNERHCGDILARKTYTPNFKNHKAKKNEGNQFLNIPFYYTKRLAFRVTVRWHRYRWKKTGDRKASPAFVCIGSDRRRAKRIKDQRKLTMTSLMSGSSNQSMGTPQVSRVLKPTASPRRTVASLEASLRSFRLWRMSASKAESSWSAALFSSVQFFLLFFFSRQGAAA